LSEPPPQAVMEATASNAARLEVRGGRGHFIAAVESRRTGPRCSLKALYHFVTLCPGGGQLRLHW
jgi:hypothetical protein